MPVPLSYLILDERLRRRRFAFALILFLLIVAIGSIPGAREEIANAASGLVLHSVAYSIITILLYTGSTGSHTRRAITAVLLVLVIGAIDEFVQSFLPYRHGAVSDWMVDGASALLTAFVLWFMLPAPVRTDPA